MILIVVTIFVLAVLNEFMPRWAFYMLMSTIYAYMIVRVLG
jgi:hypothetical protein